MTNEVKEVRPNNIWQSIERMTELLAKQGIAKEKGGSGEIKYKFRGIDDIRNATAHLQKECALVVTPKVTLRIETERTTKSGTFAMWVVLHVDFELVNTIDGSKTNVPVIAEAVDYSDKATQKALSQAYKIFAINTFNIPTEGEDDGENEKLEFKTKSVSVFESEDARNLWKVNCIHSFQNAENTLALKDIESFNHEKLVVMAASRDEQDVKVANEVRQVYMEKLVELKKSETKAGGKL